MSVRLHWLPVYVPMANVAIFMSRYGVIHTLGWDYTCIKGFENVKSTVRHLVIELDEDITLPSIDKIFYKNESHRFLLNIPGRGPVCFRCNVIGHTRATCNASYCRHCKDFTHSTEECATRRAEVVSNNRRVWGAASPETHSATEEKSTENVERETDVKDENQVEDSRLSENSGEELDKDCGANMDIQVDMDEVNHVSDSDTVQGSDADSQDGAFSTGATLYQLAKREDPDCFETASDISSDGQLDERLRPVTKKKKKNK